MLFGNSEFHYRVNIKIIEMLVFMNILALVANVVRIQQWQTLIHILLIYKIKYSNNNKNKQYVGVFMCKIIANK